MLILNVIRSPRMQTLRLKNIFRNINFRKMLAVNNKAISVTRK
jgi:hypothetical protein